tara:strand:- start:709 stop:1350 length:642 start_codon:yes stop_codon:yes gene_type:complete
MKHITIHQLNGFSLHYNITKEINNTEFVENLRRENYQAEEKRKNDNKDLYLKTIGYWCILLSFTVLVTIIQFYIRYRNSKDKKIVKIESSQGLELMPIRARLNSMESDDINLIENNDINIIHANANTDIDIEQQSSESIIPILDINNNDYIILKKKLTYKRVAKKVFYYILFIGLLLAFEYCFFQYIVLKYDPLSDNEIQYIIFNSIEKDISK